MQLIAERGFHCTSIIPARNIFWDCSSHGNQIKNYDYKIIKESELENIKEFSRKSILNLILVLDHIEEPVNFLKNLIKKGIKYIFIILETRKDEGHLPIQHLTGWNKKSLIYLAESLNSEIEFIDLNTNLYISAMLKIN